MQYPVIFCLMITLVVWPFVQPYKQTWTNFIEGFLVADVLILVLLRETDYFKTFLTGKRTAGSLSTHVKVLTLFYYVPLIVLTLAVIVSIIFRVRCALLYVCCFVSLMVHCTDAYIIYRENVKF